MDSKLIPLLASYQGDGVFNQYRDTHPEHDRPEGARFRLKNLQLFLDAFVEVRYILLAEAAGYRGCRFSGIPMTAEAQLTGPDRIHWAADQPFSRSSSRDRIWREPSATILWEALGARTDCLIWNTFPWHPMGVRGPLSNRTPRRNEVAAGIEVLQLVLGSYPTAEPVAIGRIAERTLRELGLDPHYIRHPANGGKPKFVMGINSLSD